MCDLLDRRFCGLPRGPSTVTSLDLIETLTIGDVESVPGLLLVQLFSSPPTMHCLRHLPPSSLPKYGLGLKSGT